LFFFSKFILNMFAFVKTLCQECILVFKNRYSFFPFGFSAKTRARSRTRRLLTSLFPASLAQNNSHWSQDAGYPWSLLTVLPRPPSSLHRDFSIVFSPPHTGVRAYYVSRVARIRTTCIPSCVLHLYRDEIPGYACLASSLACVFPGFHVGSVTTDWISCHRRRINRRSTRNNDFSSPLLSSPRLLYTRKWMDQNRSRDCGKEVVSSWAFKSCGVYILDLKNFRTSGFLKC